MNTIILHRSVPRSSTSRDKLTEGLREFVEVICAPVWEYGYKRDPWWVVEGTSSTGLQKIVEEVVTEDGEVVGESDGDDETVAEDDSAYGADIGEFPLKEIEIDEQFDWVERMVLEEDEYDVEVKPHRTPDKIEEEDDDRSIYSQDSFVECEEQKDHKSPVDARPTGENLLKLVNFMTKAAQIGKCRRGRWASQN